MTDRRFQTFSDEELNQLHLLFERHPNGSGPLKVVDPLHREVIAEQRIRGNGHATTVHELFDYWRHTCNHEKAKLDGKRFKKIAARLAEGYPPEKIRQAIDGAARLPYMTERGRAASGSPRQRFDDVELICRSGEKLERFAALAVPAINPPLMGKLIGG